MMMMMWSKGVLTILDHTTIRKEGGTATRNSILLNSTTYSDEYTLYLEIQSFYEFYFLYTNEHTQIHVQAVLPTNGGGAVLDEKEKATCFYLLEPFSSTIFVSLQYS